MNAKKSAAAAEKATSPKSARNSSDRSQKNNSVVQSLMDIWSILATVSPEKPLTIKEIVDKFNADPSVSENLSVSASTVKRYLPGEIYAINTLHPQTVICSDQENSILYTYSTEDEVADEKTGAKKKQETLHVVVENRQGDIQWDGEMTAVLTPSAASPISQKTLDRRLPTLMAQFHGTRKSQPPLISLSALVKKESGKYVSALQIQKGLDERQNDEEPFPTEPSQEKQEKKSHDKSPTRRYYLQSILTPGEWRIFSDMVKVYPYISKQDTEKFLAVLQRMAPGVDLRSSRLGAPKRSAHMQFKHIDVLDKAIRETYMVNVKYGQYRLAAESRNTASAKPSREKFVISTASNDVIVPKLESMRNFNKAGQPFVWTEVEPYELLWSNGYYYLVCKVGLYDRSGSPKTDENGVRIKEMRNLRLDRILDISVVKQDNQPVHFQKDKDFDLYQYRDRSPVMYPGEPIRACLRCPESMLSTLQDFFGSAIISYSKPTESEKLPASKRFTNVLVTGSEKGISLFALQYVDQVELLSPPELREKVKHTLQAAAAKYQ